MQKNERIPLVGWDLQKPKQLTETICLLQLKSDCGGSALTYLGSEGQRYCIIKEIYPLMSDQPLRREGNLVWIDGGTDDRKNEIRKQLAETAEREEENAAELCRYKHGNSIFSFPCTRIDKKKLKDDFRGTEAQYLLIDTCSGQTLDQYVKEKCGVLSLDQALILTSSILQSVQFFHEVKNILHMDLKPDNIYFPKQLKLENVFAILLDCGSAAPIDQVSAAEKVSVSNGYSSYEVQKLGYYISQHYHEQEQKYRNLIGCHSDLASVGYILLRLLLHTKPVMDWIKKKIGGENAGGEVQAAADKLFAMLYRQSNQPDLDDKLEQNLLPALKEEYPYAADRICRMVSRAVYIADDREKLLEGRFSSCSVFQEEVETLRLILAEKGAHPEVLAAASRKAFLKAVGADSDLEAKDLIGNDRLYNPEWFTPAVLLNGKNEQD